MMNSLTQLQFSLSQIFREAQSAGLIFENSDAVKSLQKINHELGVVSAAPASNSITEVVLAYAQTRKTANARELRYVCYGASMRLKDGWCLLADEKLRNELLAEVAHLENLSQRLRCFQALLNSYFSFDRDDQRTSKAAHAGWEILRDWLVSQRVQLQNERIKTPNWFAVLTEHENLLSDKPCDRYGADLLYGKHSSLTQVTSSLGISGDSWVMQEVMLAQVKAASALGDDLFKTQYLDSLLSLLLNPRELKVSDLLKRRAMALLISRYARCASSPEHSVLRDAAVSIFGNPWLKRTEWDAWVKNFSNQPDDEAREMINAWLTRQLITDFFALLSSDGQADQRRLNYWLRFVSAIEGTPWLALGPDAMRNNSQPYRDLRERAKGRLLRLDNPGAANNNAFVMRIGGWMIVEFGVTGNACYLYDKFSR